MKESVKTEIENFLLDCNAYDLKYRYEDGNGEAIHKKLFSGELVTVDKNNQNNWTYNCNELGAKNWIKKHDLEVLEMLKEIRKSKLPVNMFDFLDNLSYQNLANLYMYCVSYMYLMGK